MLDPDSNLDPFLRKYGFWRTLFVAAVLVAVGSGTTTAIKWILEHM